MVEHMVEGVDDTGHPSVPGRVEIRVGVGRRRRWTDEEKGRIVAEAVAPGAVVAEVARRHDITPQHLFNWIRAAKDGHFALPGDGDVSFVPVVAIDDGPTVTVPAPEPAASIEIAIGSVRLSVHNGADARTIEAVLRAVRHSFA